jgi:hypothetical protein
MTQLSPARTWSKQAPLAANSHGCTHGQHEFEAWCIVAVGDGLPRDALLGVLLLLRTEDKAGKVGLQLLVGQIDAKLLKRVGLATANPPRARSQTQSQPQPETKSAPHPHTPRSEGHVACCVFACVLLPFYRLVHVQGRHRWSRDQGGGALTAYRKVFKAKDVEHADFTVRPAQTKRR